MSHRRSWSAIVTHYRLTLAYIAVIGTVSLVLQVWTATRR